MPEPVPDQSEPVRLHMVAVSNPGLKGQWVPLKVAERELARLRAENEALKANVIDRPRVRRLIAAALAGEEYSIAEMASDLEHAMNVNDRLDVERERLCEAVVAVGAAWQRGDDAEIGTAIGAALAAVDGSGESDENGDGHAA